jgi:hypothetical protein
MSLDGNKLLFVDNYERASSWNKLYELNQLVASSTCTSTTFLHELLCKSYGSQQANKAQRIRMGNVYSKIRFNKLISWWPASHQVNKQQEGAW